MDKTEVGANYEKEWESALAKFVEKYPEEGKEFKQLISGELPAGWEKALPVSCPSRSRLAVSSPCCCFPFTLLAFQVN
jgi:transketolase